MNRTTRTLIVIGVATVLAAVAAFGVYVAFSRRAPVEVEMATVSVAVAARALPTGTRLGEKDLKVVAWPADSPPPDAFAKPEELLNRGLIAAVVENEPITKAKLAPVEAGAGLPPTIPEGMRAMSVKVDEVVGVAGFVLPGTRVDVVVTVRETPDRREAMSRTVVSNVLVLTAGTRIDQEEAKGGQPLPSTVVTLAVTPADAERIALAAAEGQISLALRNPLDTAPTETPGVRVGALMEGRVASDAAASAGAATRPVRAVRPAPAPAAAPAAVPVPVRVYTVETIRAAKRTEEVVH
jgi:pilus assembly protein CpaB